MFYKLQLKDKKSRVESSIQGRKHNLGKSPDYKHTRLCIYLQHLHLEFQIN